MNPDAAFLVEDFLEAITSQLDRTQDALRLKAVNRPLTYAIRDFSMDLKVFVEMGPDGQVRFRATGPNEEGASVVQVGFTTVTRPMIDENTVSLSAVRSPSLDELGLGDDERRRLERLGVRNAAQLARLGRSTGESTVARFAGIPVNRLRSALASGRPSVSGAAPVVAPPRAPSTDAPGGVGPADDSARPEPRPQPPASRRRVERPAPFEGPAGDGRPGPDPTPANGGRRPGSVPRPAPPPVAPAVPPGPVAGSPVVRVPATTRKLRIDGRHLADAVNGVRLAGRALEVDERDDRGIVVAFGAVPPAGALEIDLGDEGMVTLELAVDGGDPDAEAPLADAGWDDDVAWHDDEPFAEGGWAEVAPLARRGDGGAGGGGEGDDPWRPE